MAENFLSQVRRIEENTEGIPYGQYKGTWSGYRVTFETPHGKYEGKASLGVRGIVPCVVEVKPGGFRVIPEDKYD